MENTPHFIFDLISEKSFRQLSADEKQAVLDAMNENHYQELYETLQMAKQMVFDEEELSLNPEIKNILKDRIRQKNKSNLSVFTPIAFWKVAASFVLFSAIAYYLYHIKINQIEHKIISKVDTVYLEKTFPSMKVYDTIYIQSSNLTAASAMAKPIKPPHGIPDQIQPTEIYSITNLNQLSVDEINQPKNNKMGQPIKDDTLISFIGFTTL